MNLTAVEKAMQAAQRRFGHQVPLVKYATLGEDGIVRTLAVGPSDAESMDDLVFVGVPDAGELMRDK